MRRIIQRTITTIDITSYIYVDETGSARTVSLEPVIDAPTHYPLLTPIEQPAEEGQAAIQT